MPCIPVSASLSLSVKINLFVPKSVKGELVSYQLLLLSLCGYLSLHKSSSSLIMTNCRKMFIYVQE